MVRTNSRRAKENQTPNLALNTKSLQHTKPPSSRPTTDLTNYSRNERVVLAIEAINHYGFRKNGRPIYSLLEASRHFEVPRTTLSARLHGRPTRQEGHKHEQRLDDAQETLLVEWVKELGYRGVPLAPGTVTGYAEIITGNKLGSSWCRRFRARHPDLKAVWTTSLERCRAGALNETRVGLFYDIIQDLIERFSLSPENIYNMDEKGCQMGISGRARVLVDRDQRDVYQVQEGDRELVTIVECIAADGGGSEDPTQVEAEIEGGPMAIPPMVVYRGQRRDLEWGRDNPCNAR